MQVENKRKQYKKAKGPKKYKKYVVRRGESEMHDRDTVTNQLSLSWSDLSFSGIRLWFLKWRKRKKEGKKTCKTYHHHHRLTVSQTHFIIGQRVCRMEEWTLCREILHILYKNRRKKGVCFRVCFCKMECHKTIYSFGCVGWR